MLERERGSLRGTDTRSTSPSWDEDQASWGVYGLEELEGKAEEGGENGLSTGAWKAEEYEGVSPPCTAAIWAADDLFFQILERVGTDEVDTKDEFGRSQRRWKEGDGFYRSFSCGAGVFCGL